jgi:peptidoglycan/xylan/chitin deacetylase (PgdA/CDA1 family)
MSPETGVIAGAMAVVGTVLVGGGWGVLHPHATLFGPVVWRGPRDRPAVALTFDDGPHPEYTTRIAEILSRSRTPATFFCVGQEVERYASLAGALHRAGHQLENHTFAHGTGRDLFSTRRLSADLRRCQDALAGVTATEPRYYRPAVGIRNPVVHRAARSVGLEIVTWTRSARDGAFALGPGRARRMGEQAGPGSILALHDGCSHERSRLLEQTVRNLPQVLQRLNDRGLTLLTLRELLNPA